MKLAFHLSRLRAALLLAVLAGVLGGCGQKGPLYLPARPAPVPTPAPKPAPAPADNATPASK